MGVYLYSGCCCGHECISVAHLCTIWGKTSALESGARRRNERRRRRRSVVTAIGVRVAAVIPRPSRAVAYTPAPRRPLVLTSSDATRLHRWPQWQACPRTFCLVSPSCTRRTSRVTLPWRRKFSLGLPRSNLCSRLRTGRTRRSLPRSCRTCPSLILGLPTLVWR